MALTDDATLLREEKAAKRAELLAEAKLEQQLSELQAKYDELLAAIAAWEANPTTGNEFAIKDSHRQAQGEAVMSVLDSIDAAGLAILKEYTEEKRLGVFEIVYDVANHCWKKRWLDTGETIIIRRGF